MKLPLYSEAALNCDRPDQGLRRGDVLKLVDERQFSDGTHDYSVAVLNALGDAIRVTTLPDWALESLRGDEVLWVRPA
jgi:hypothetical protein